MISPVAPFLTEFKPFRPDPKIAVAEDNLLAEAALEAESPAESTALGSLEAEPEDDGAKLGQALSEARQAGATEAEARCAADFEARVQALQAEHDQQRAAEREAWVQGEAARLTQTLAESLSAIESRIAETVADVLEPLLSRALAGRTVADLREAIATLLADDEDRVIRVSGPPDLIDAVAASCADRPGLLFEPADMVDVTIRTGSTLIESRMALWADTLRTAIGAEL